jgi:cytochrome c-type biogenesis protein CcmH/NrfG
MLGLGRVHFHRRDYKEMAAIARRVTELQPRSAAAFSMLGDAYYKMYRYDDALSAYERAAEFGSSDAQQGLARVRKAIGER